MRNWALFIALLACIPAHAALRGTATAANSTTGSSITISVSSIGIQVGDVVLLAVLGGGGSTNTFTFPAGFSTISGATSPLAVTSTGGTLGLECKTATASDTSYTVSYSKSDYLSAQVRVYSGRQSCSNITVTATTTDQPGSASPVTFALTGVTPASGDDVVAIVGTHYYSSVTPSYSPSTGFANGLVSYAAVQFSPQLIGSDYVNHPATATGTVGGTLTEADGNTYDYAGYVISIPQASGSTCANAGWNLSTRSFTVPTAGSGSFWHCNGSSGSVDCSTQSYWQSTRVCGVN